MLSRQHIVQENDYYPFGSTFRSVGSSTNRYFRENKERISDYDWNKHDYTGRYFSLDIDCRGLSLDPMAEKYPWISPYALFLNNPMRVIDPTGKWVGSVHSKMIIEAVEQLRQAGVLNINDEQAKAMIDDMIQGSVNADKNQKNEDSYLHYMRDPKDSSEKAKERIQNHVDAKISDFQETGNYESLGQAAHPMMDAVSPTHATKNADGSYEPIVTDLPSIGLHTPIIPAAVKWISHGLGDINPTKKQMTEAVGNVKNIIIKGMKLEKSQVQQGKGKGLIAP